MWLQEVVWLQLCAKDTRADNACVLHVNPRRESLRDPHPDEQALCGRVRQRRSNGQSYEGLYGEPRRLRRHQAGGRLRIGTYTFFESLSNLCE